MIAVFTIGKRRAGTPSESGSIVSTVVEPVSSDIGDLADPLRKDGKSGHTHANFLQRLCDFTDAP
jgi:hypothetical protein